ncbi:hypothetical protein D7X33_29820 [Butyricicoccus sp. 1XD8-22]|nr:hypothetical protein D7X33_29820 [Butyricicoccus sp. 1XD8-22]
MTLNKLIEALNLMNQQNSNLTQIANTAWSLSRPLSQLSANVSTILNTANTTLNIPVMMSTMQGLQIAPSFSDIYPSADALKFTISTLSSSTVESSHIIHGLLDNLPVFTECLENLVCEESLDELRIEIPAESLDALYQAAPVIPEETRPKFEKVISHEPESQHKYLNFETFKWLIGVILSIIQIYLTLASQPASDDKSEWVPENQCPRCTAQRELEDQYLEIFQQFLDHLEHCGIEFSTEEDSLPDETDTCINQSDSLIDIDAPEQKIDNCDCQNVDLNAQE